MNEFDSALESSIATMLARVVKNLRVSRGLTTLEVERRSKADGGEGISNGYISRIENGLVGNLSASKTRALAKGLGVDVSELKFALLDEEPDTARITEKRLARINFGYRGMPKKKQRELDPIIDLLEREYQRLTKEEK